jgi:hypothetical protein
MDTVRLHASRRSTSSLGVAFVVAAVLLAVGMATGCGSGGSMTKVPPPANTNVTVMVSSTANDLLPEFDVNFQGISLTGQSGNTVQLLSLGMGEAAEFTHINGLVEPLVTASIPQDVYTSATLAPGGFSGFVCIALGPVDGQETLATDSFDNVVQTSAVTVTLPSPITVTGASMGLSLNLQVSQSATVGDCLTPDGFEGFSVNPAFTLTALNLSSSPTNSANGKVVALDGQITAIGTGDSFTISIPDVAGARPLSVNSGSTTVYQGISNFSALAVGTFVDLDGAIQSDGSLGATRIAVEDSSAGDVFRGPVIEVVPSVGVLSMHGHQWQGQDVLGLAEGSMNLDFSGSIFQISDQLTNLGGLPFVPSFSAANMVPGQEVYASFSSSTFVSPRPPATTMTLMPQTIDGTVTASSQSGNFTDYTVTLAPYDLFPMLAVQPEQTNVEKNPSQVEVYVDNHTQMLNTQGLAPGSTLRFYGLVFNDNGTLRMDCAQVNDGVAFVPPQSNSGTQAQVGQPQTIRRIGPAGLPQTITTVTRSNN